jgi:hypothetical protein
MFGGKSLHGTYVIVLSIQCFFSLFQRLVFLSPVLAMYPEPVRFFGQKRRATLMPVLAGCVQYITPHGVIDHNIIS